MSSESVGAFGNAFATGAAGVAALDTPQLTQTKAEIRTLVAEIAELSSADIECPEFMRGMLSRVCMAMGATAAAVWNVDLDQSVRLSASHNFPAALSETDGEAAAAHRRVLTCVAVEGQPVLVPPGSVRIDTERPTNPIDEALLIVPVRIHSRVDRLLEIIQPGSGGPAAQRGYLRFVAQMADLLADYLRRDRLRELATNAEYVQCLQSHLQTVCAATSTKEQWQAVAKALSNLLEANLAMLLSRSTRQWRVRAISEIAAFDPRSETVVAAERLVQKITNDTDRGLDNLTLLTESPAPADASEASTPSPYPSAESLRALLGCERLYAASLTGGEYQLLLATDKTFDQAALCERAQELLSTFGSLLSYERGPSGWASGLFAPARSRSATGQRSRWERVERWIVRGSTVGLVVAVALFPTPNQVAAVAVLEAADKQLYYAPASATIERVLVDSGQSVAAGELLLELSDKQLEARLNEVSGQRLTAETQLAQESAALKRGQQLPQQQDELESHTVQLKITLAALDKQLAILRAQAQLLKIVAKSDSTVTTWDARNRLQGRPVTAGQLLVATCAPDTTWRLQVSIPEGRAGMVQDALAKSPDGLPVQFSLSSYPSNVQTGRLVSLSKQLLKDDGGKSKVLGTVLVDGAALPAKTDGAVARAAIDCGRVTALWFVLRDAYSEASAWIRMTW